MINSDGKQTMKKSKSTHYNMDLSKSPIYIGGILDSSNIEK